MKPSIETEHKQYHIIIRPYNIDDDRIVFDWTITTDGLYDTVEDAQTDAQLLIDMALQNARDNKQSPGKGASKLPDGSEFQE